MLPKQAPDPTVANSRTSRAQLHWGSHDLVTLLLYSRAITRWIVTAVALHSIMKSNLWLPVRRLPHKRGRVVHEEVKGINTHIMITQTPPSITDMPTGDATMQPTTTTTAELTDTELDHGTGAGTDLTTGMTGDDGSNTAHD